MRFTRRRHAEQAGIAGTKYDAAPSLHRAEQTQILLFVSLALLVALAVAYTVLFVKERQDATCFRTALKDRASITVRDTQLQDNLDLALGKALKILLDPRSTEEQRRAAVAALLKAEEDHDNARKADDAARAKLPLQAHC